MMNRRGFINTMLTALGAAAVANPLTDLMSHEIHATLPPAAHMVLPAGQSFFVERVTLRNCGTESIVSPDLLIGSWKLVTGLNIAPGEWFNYSFGPRGGYQVDPEEKVSLIGPKNSMVQLSGIHIPHERGADLVNWCYWLRV